MIDPSDVTRFERADPELQEFLLFCLIVAGKKASTQAVKLESFLYSENDKRTPPFKIIQKMINSGSLLDNLKRVGMGQYTRLERLFALVLDLDPRLCTCEDLEALKGIGPKTARYFLLHSREDQQLAVLDRHILKWLTARLGVSAPKNTPSSKIKYGELENAYLAYCADHSLSPADLDLAIWNWYANGRETPVIPV